MGADGGYDHPGLEKHAIVERSQGDGERTSATRKAREVAGEKWKKLWLDSILDSFTFEKLADSTEVQYQRRLIKYLEWVWIERGKGLKG